MRLAPPLQRQLEQAEAQRQQRRGLHSSLHLEQGLRNHWYPVAFSSKLPGDTLVPFDLFGQAWVLFRDGRGVAACVRDQCAHRACPLSLGRVVDGKVQVRPILLSSIVACATGILKKASLLLHQRQSSP